MEQHKVDSDLRNRLKETEAYADLLKAGLSDINSFPSMLALQYATRTQVQPCVHDPSSMGNWASGSLMTRTKMNTCLR